MTDVILDPATLAGAWRRDVIARAKNTTHPAAPTRAHLDAALEALLLQALSETLARTRASAPGHHVHAPAAMPHEAAAAHVPHVPRGRPMLLSERERQVLACIDAGDSNKHIARRLDLSVHTVKRHVANILQKLQAKSRGEAAARWRTVR